MVHYDKQEKPVKILEAHFYKQSSGKEPLRLWLKSLPLDEMKIIGSDIKSVEFGWPIGMPCVKSLKEGLWEVRSSLNGRIARVLFCIKDSKMILLHGFTKKTQKTPLAELNLARERMKKL